MGKQIESLWIDNLDAALRGGVNNGFRAPSLAPTQFSTTHDTAVFGLA
ncbi:MAG: hypothetical protein ABSC94_22135 [Polyangiaceae bacterium]|jgi:hypothetical protein